MILVEKQVTIRINENELATITQALENEFKRLDTMLKDNPDEARDIIPQRTAVKSLRGAIGHLMGKTYTERG